MQRRDETCRFVAAPPEIKRCERYRDTSRRDPPPELTPGNQPCQKRELTSGLQQQDKCHDEQYSHTLIPYTADVTERLPVIVTERQVIKDAVPVVNADSGAVPAAPKPVATM